MSASTLMSLENLTCIEIKVNRQSHNVLIFNTLMQDLRPTRLRCCVTLLERFLEEFASLNPISQTALVVTRAKRAELVSELAGNPRRHSAALRRLAEAANPTKGEPSLQNALNLALRGLRNMPPHASREVLVLMGSLTTCDPGDVEATVEECKKLNVRCSVISLAAEVRIYRHLTKRTGGDFHVILDDAHLKELLHTHLEPPPSAASAEASLIKMGFPSHTGHSGESGAASGLGMCMCHLDTPSSASVDGSGSGSGNANSPAAGKLSVSGFLCPQCGGKYCELPAECRCCGLTLVSAPHLARSYHHLFPLVPFDEVLYDILLFQYVQTHAILS